MTGSSDQTDLSGRADRVARALQAVPRAPFLPPDLRSLASHDGPLPIGYGQTNSQPMTVALMLELLDVQPGHRVLDLGAGSGWTTALLAHLVGPTGTVLGVERHPELVAGARRALDVSGSRGTVRVASAGTLGAPQEAPFDRVLVSAEAQQLPAELVAQLGEGGVMVIPVREVMHRLERRGDRLYDTEHGAFRFVPLIQDR